VDFAMADYPKTLMELEKAFPDDACCRAYLASIRWPEGFVCPACGNAGGLAIRRNLWRCNACDRESSVMAVTIFQSGKRKPEETDENLLPRVHRVASLLKRWLMGTHQGGVQDKHMDEYLNEFTFRFNRRTSNTRGLLFYRLVEQAVQIEPTTYKMLVEHNGWG